MKKLIIAISLLVCATFANASYLYWQVSSSDFTNQEFNNKSITGFNVVAIDSTKEYTSSGSDRHVLDSYSFDSSIGDYSKDTPPVGWSTATSGANYADVTAFNTGYSYYIEIVGAENQILGQTSSGLTYATAVTNGSIVSDLGGTALAQVSTQLWQGGHAYAVPEPTGAMLMILGLAMLGLKRRKV